jgi:DNA-directed RNA polymerase subunit beta'
MRTFHTGGTVSGGGFQSRIEARHDGTVQYHNVRFIERPVEAPSAPDNQQSGVETEKIVLSRNAQIRIIDANGYTVERHTVDVGARLCVEDGQAVTKEDSQNGVQPTLLLEWDPYRVPILTEHAGRVVFKDILEGKTMREDKATGLAEWVIIEYRGEDQPQIEIHDDAGEILISYQMPTGAHLSVTDGEAVESGMVLARLPREKGQSRDIVTGLPRVTELFEARRPKDTAVISEIEGHVELEGVSRGVRILRVVNGDLQISHRIPQGKHLIVQTGDWVEAGERLTDGPINPHDILKVKGEEAVQNYLVKQVQDVYRTQGERINDKHIEVIVRQMLGKARIQHPGDTDFLEEDEVDRSIFNRMNRRVQENGGQAATAEPILQGITKASLSTESFISAASFQQTTNVLTRASVIGKRDRLVGLKENVIMGHLIPAGTGVSKFRKIRAFPKTEPQPEFPDSASLPDSVSLPVDEEAAD